MNTRTIKTIRIISGLIALIGAVVSYGTQRGLLGRWGVDALAAAAIPLTVDLLAIICALVIHTPGVDAAGRRVAYRVLFLAGAVSVAANGLAGTTVGSRIAHVWCVLAYLAAEGVAAKVKPAAQARPAVTDEQLARRQEAARKGAETKRRNREAAAKAERTAARAAKRTDRELAAMVGGYLPENAPVSPAPAG